MTYEEILRQNWGYGSFRGIQREIIESIGSGRDTLGLMPTGGGKSITFQVPALSMEGVCIVITPLISLMKDQVAALRRRHLRAAYINSEQNHDEVLRILENAIFGAVKFLYISPERLASELFQAKLRHMRICFITVDEAHCISQWGYDFRPSYLKIADIREMTAKRVPILALTATATPRVVDDIQEKLLFEEKNCIRMSFERKNLSYEVKKSQDKDGEMVKLLNDNPGCSIIYVRSRRRTSEIANILCDAGISALSYHAGLDGTTRDQRQAEWTDDRVRVMVATNAFGMGIDKPDVRMVIHEDCPDSLEAYFQEAGRAGRDGKPSRAIMLYNGNDLSKLRRRIGDTFPERTYIKEVYEHLAYFFQVATGFGGGKTHTFDIERFCVNFHHYPVRADAALRILDRAGYIEYNVDTDSKSRVTFLIDRDDLYRIGRQSPNEEQTIVALLRNYSGLFTSFAYVEETFLAKQSGLQPDVLHETLKSLSRKHIIQYIPRRNIPTITYRIDRVDTEYLSIPRDAYELLKEQYEERIGAVIRYLTNDHECRSRQLLAYFGETKSSECGHCDVCKSHDSDYLSESMLAPAIDKILLLLDDGMPHDVTEINGIDMPTELLDAALKHLIDEEYIDYDDGEIRKK